MIKSSSAHIFSNYWNISYTLYTVLYYIQNVSYTCVYTDWVIHASHNYKNMFIENILASS